jgi:hypothetical protein
MHAADELATLILASAQTVADLAGKDPRTIKRDEKPVAYLQTPHGQKALYQLTQDLLDAAAKHSGQT